MKDIYTITLPWPDRAIASNGRGNRFKKARLVKSARGTAEIMAKSAGVNTPMPNAIIMIEYYPKERRGDVHNVASSLKAYIDGIADAMGCDDRKFDVDYPRIWAGTSKQGEVVFRIRPNLAGAV